MPDIDIDFCMNRRGEVIDYVKSKYGDDQVAQIITFNTMAAKAAIKDVGRALDMPYGEVDRIAKLIPATIGITIDHALKESPPLAAAYEGDPRIRELIDTAMRLEGLVRQAIPPGCSRVNRRRGPPVFDLHCSASAGLTHRPRARSLVKWPPQTRTVEARHMTSS